MKILQLRTISGPNVFHSRPVIVMTLHLEDLADTASNEIPGYNERLLAMLPGLNTHRCSPGRPGGFVERLQRGTYFAHMIEHIALELSAPAGISVGYGKTVYDGAPNRYKIIVRYRSEKGMRFLLRTAVDLAQAAVDGREFDISGAITEAKEIIQAAELGPSTRAIVNAAERRGIPWHRLNEHNLIQFGYGKNRRLIQATASSLTSDIAVDIAKNKDLTKELLRQAGIPVPRGKTVYSQEDAVSAFREMGMPVAIKPRDGNHGKGVSLNLEDDLAVAEAFVLAQNYSRAVLIEELFMGDDYRIVTVGGKMVAAARRAPAHVTGDGVHTVMALIELENRNPLRGEGHEKPMTKIKFDAVAEAYLRRRGIDLTTVPPAGTPVYLRETANLSTGGTATDVTDIIHPEIKRMCERAARVVGLDICGIDLVIKDITQPVRGQRGGIIELNAGPGIRMHHYPAQGEPRDVGGAIIEHLYPQGSTHRIPILTITGTNGKTTVTRLIGHSLTETGLSVGMTTSDGIHIGHDQITAGDTTGPGSARTVLSDPSVEVAVLETARGGIVRRGLGYDWSDVAVITNIQPDHIGQDGIEGVEDILKIKTLTVERLREGGTLVLNADDPLLARLPESAVFNEKPRRLVYFSLQADQIVVRRHVSEGGTAYYVKDGLLTENDGGRESAIIAVNAIPLTLAGTAHYQIANALAAVAAGRAHGLSIEQVALGLQSFLPNHHNSGRANTYRVGKGHLIIDFGHNPEALRAVCDMTARWSDRKVTGVISSPGDRKDEIIRMNAKVAAHGFDKIVIREDVFLRGRESGVAARILHDAVHAEVPGHDCVLELDEMKALERALNEMIPGEVVFFFYDKIDNVRAKLAAHHAVPVETILDVIMPAQPGLSTQATGRTNANPCFTSLTESSSGAEAASTNVTFA